MDNKEVTLTLTHDELAELCKLIALASHPYYSFTENENEPVFNTEVNEAVQHKIQTLAEVTIPDYLKHTIPADCSIKFRLWCLIESISDQVMNFYGERNFDLPLGSLLAKRDFEERYGIKINNITNTSPMWPTYQRLLRWYWDEFEKFGVGRVRVIENASAGMN